MSDATEAPVHIVDPPNVTTRCGLKGFDRHPYLPAEAVQQHIDWRNVPVCPDCAVDGWPGKEPS